jgi:hypothetical protein
MGPGLVSLDQLFEGGHIPRAGALHQLVVLHEADSQFLDGKSRTFISFPAYLTEELAATRGA